MDEKSADAPEFERQAWGYASAGFRELTEDERAALQSEIRKWRGVRWRYLAATYLAAIALLIGFMAGYGTGEVWGYPLCFAGLAGALFFPLLKNDAKKRRLVVERELADSRAERFVAPGSEEAEESGAFEIYGGSGRVVGSSDPIGSAVANPQEVARRPGRRSPSAMPARIDFFPGGKGTVVRHRRLSLAEMDELRKIVAAIPGMTPLAAVCVLLPLVRVGTWIKSMSGRPISLWEALGLIAVLTFLSWIVWAVIRRFRLISSLQKDLTTGDVAVVEATAINEDARHEEPAEYLPNSQLYWTVGGRPAAWRSS